MDPRRRRKCLWRPGGKNSRRNLRRRKVGIRVLCYDPLPLSPLPPKANPYISIFPRVYVRSSALPWGNPVTHFCHRPPVGYIWRTIKQKYQIRQRCDLVNGCEWGTIYLWLCSDCGCKVWCFLEGERFVLYPFPRPGSDLLMCVTSYKHRGDFPTKRLCETDKGLTNYLQFARQIWQGFGLDWLYRSRCRKYISTIPQSITRADHSSRFLRSIP